MPLRLLAQAEDDVPALSALVQDAAIRRVDMNFDAKARRMVLLMARYCWELPTPTRCRAALRFEHVLSAQQRGFAALPHDSTLDLLSIHCTEPYIKLIFAGGPLLRLQVDSVDILLEDFGDSWPAVRRPRH